MNFQVHKPFLRSAAETACFNCSLGAIVAVLTIMFVLDVDTSWK